MADMLEGDKLPDINEIMREIDGHDGRQTIILSLGEYARLFQTREREPKSSLLKRIWNKMVSIESTTKYLIPIYGGSGLIPFPLDDDARMSQCIYELTNDDDKVDRTITVYNDEFAGRIDADASSISEWIRNWNKHYSSDKRDIAIITRLAKYVQDIRSNISIHVVSDPYSYIVSISNDGKDIKKEWGNDNFWAGASEVSRRGTSFLTDIKKHLNLSDSAKISHALSMWRNADDNARRLIWIWGKLEKSNDYCSRAIADASMPSDIPISIRDMIFSNYNPNDQTWVEDRRAALRNIDWSIDNGYRQRLDSITPVSARFEFLICNSEEEKAYAIKTASLLLRDGISATEVSMYVKKIFPLLSEYLVPSSEEANITKYFAWYRAKKIINKIIDETPPIIADMGLIESRNKVIKMRAPKGANKFWVDGLGMEWAPLLMKMLHASLDDISNIECITSHSIVPTETAFNKQWDPMADEKWDRLDKLSHNGLPDDKDYYTCIANQFEIMNDIVAKVSDMMTSNDAVVLTGDHGSSRLAALKFHDKKNYAIDPPKGATVRSYGRYCELSGDELPPGYIINDDIMTIGNNNDKKCLILKDYSHFKQSGKAIEGILDEDPKAGEIHGGLTPEEYLVPVIIITRKEPLPKKETPKRRSGIEINDDIFAL